MIQPLLLSKKPSVLPGKSHKSGGFVLVAVLLMIALAVVLIVTTSSISQVERKAVSNSSKEELARQNALFALNLAVSQLQVAAGPDQRVTATADILNSNSVTPSPVAQPYWTGVWKSYNPTWTNTAAPWFRPQPLDTDTNGNAGTVTSALRPWSSGGGGTSTNITWLVSGATNNSVVSPLASTISWTNNSVLLASNWGTNSATVLVPVVTMKNGVTNTGRYAYWVSDEGVKAKVSLSDTNMSTATVTLTTGWIPSLLHHFAPSAMNISSVMTNYGITTGLTTDFRSNTNISKLTSLGGLAFITNSTPVFTNNTLAADLTTYSYGVLSDTRQGGLKQDLTAAFESSSTSGGTNWATLQVRSGSGLGNDACCVYRATNVGIAAANTLTNLQYQGSGGGNGSTPFTNDSTVFDGPRWISLYTFYNLYKSTMPTNPVTSIPVSGTSPAGVGGTANGGNSLSISAANTLEARNLSWYETNTATHSGNQFTVLPIAPTQIADRIDSAISAYSYTTNVYHGVTNNATPFTVYNIRVQYYPLIVIQNPYSVALTISNNLTYSITKNALGSTQVSLTCSNPATMAYETVSNSTYKYVTNTTNADGSITTTTNSAANYTGTNLFPVATNSTASTGSFNLYQGGYYPMYQSISNITTLQPGEIRAFGLNGTPVSTNTMGGACGFPILSSTSTVSIDNYQYCPIHQVGWVGTTNRNSIVTVSINGLGVAGYNVSRWYPNGALNKWPGSVGGGSYGDATPIVLQASGSGAATASANPTNLGTIGNMYDNNTTIRLLGCFERLKGIYSDGSANFINSSTNVPMMIGNSVSFNAGRSGGKAAFGGGVSGVTTEVYAVALNSVTPANGFFSDTTDANGHLVTQWGVLGVGSTNATYSNPQRLVLRDIPIAPMTSLGQFQHFEDWNYNKLYVAYSFPAMSIGGGFGGVDVCGSTPASFAYNTYFWGNSGGGRMMYDYSYLANEALFDTYFFSTVPPPNGFNWGSGGYGAFSNSTITAAAIAANQPLPNSRLVYYRKNGTNPAVADLQNEIKASADLLIDGAFNVNSTSVAAWKALITSLSGQSMRLYNYNTGSPQDWTPSATFTNPIPRFWSICSSSSPNVPWEGMRCLTDAQATALAQEIVKQVRLRGPFLSMGDFLNRRLGSYVGQTNALGALQAAIENTATNGTASDVNYCIKSVYSQVPTVVPTSIASNTAVGIPGYLTQSDIMQAFAPVMTARSDTFVIRVYGESDKPSTNSLTTTYSQAWGEAVVQRLPEFFDQTDGNLSANASTYGLTGVNYALGDATPLRNSSGYIVSPSNQTFGRRFKIVSFRWLNQNEL